MTALPVGIVFHSKQVLFDTPGILTGVEVYTPQAGEVLLPFGWVSVVTVWDGTPAMMTVYPQGGALPGDAIFSASASAADTIDSGGHLRSFPRSSLPSNAAQVIDANPLLVKVDDGAGGNPGSSQGEALIVLAVGVPYLPGAAGTGVGGMTVT